MGDFPKLGSSGTFMVKMGFFAFFLKSVAKCWDVLVDESRGWKGGYLGRIGEKIGAILAALDAKRRYFGGLFSCFARE